MGKMTTGDWKGDTAKGARYYAEKQARMWDRRARQLPYAVPENKVVTMPSKTNEVLEFLETEVNVRGLMRKLTFDLDNFEQANIEQPRLYLEAGRYRTKAALSRARLELRLDTRQAEQGVKLRNKQEGEKKSLTEKAIADRIMVDEQVQEYRKRLYLAKATEEWAKQLLEAYTQRQLVLGIISKVRASEIASELRAVKEQMAMAPVRQAAEKVRRRFREEES